MADGEWNRINGVRALVESGIDKLPDFYVKPPDQRPTAEELSSHSIVNEIPTIDLSSLQDGTSEEEAVISQLLDASEKYGFFQVINHGVDGELMKRMLSVAHEFFQMPLEDKMDYYTTDINSPLRYGTSFNPPKEKHLEWQDNVLHRFMPEHKDEPHPWPSKPSSYRPVAEEYFNQVKSLAKRLLRALSKGLGLEADYLDEAFGKHQIAFRHNYYPPCPNPELVMGLSGHSDIGGLTIVLQDQDITGLQVKLPSGKWSTIYPVKGALVVNISDQLQIFTNGRLKSIEHRAVTNSEKARVSVALFFDPSSDVRVEPIQKLLDSDHPPLYRSCVFGDYIANLFSKELAGKTWVESLRISEA